MKTNTTELLVSALREVAEYKEGKKKLSERTIPQSIDVCMIRRQLGLTQEQFSERYHIPLDTMRNWEQGRREPRGAARILLLVIQAHPDLVEHVLRREK